MNINSLNSFLIFALIILGHLVSHSSSFTSSMINGFTVDLIHRESKISPFYNESTASGAAIRRSLSRTNNHFRGSSIDLLPVYGDYLMKISLGSPPVESFAIMDTGSDLSWIQCAPCRRCYPQDYPMFNPARSSSYKVLACDADACKSSENYLCVEGTNTCGYNVRYLDKSFTSGVLATETISFDGGLWQPNFTFGCGHRTKGFFSRKGSGLVGLGRGSLSLASQLRDGSDLQTFSYCLVPPTSNANSKLSFGENAALQRGINTVVSTPILSDTNFYYLNLEGASIGGTKIANRENNPTNGNIVIDSGTMLTTLEPGFYSAIEAAVKRVAGMQPVLHKSKDFRLCFGSFPKKQIDLVFHFTGADVTLKNYNIFGKVDKLYCLMIIPENGSSRILGNMAQINFHVKYDLPKRLVSFAPADCSKF